MSHAPRAWGAGGRGRVHPSNLSFATDLQAVRRARVVRRAIEGVEKTRQSSTGAVDKGVNLWTRVDAPCGR